MSDLERLVTGEDLGASLLRSAKEDRVPEGAALRAVRAAVLASATAASAPTSGTTLLHRLGTWVKAPAAKLTYLAVSVIIASGAIAAGISTSPSTSEVGTSVSQGPRSVTSAHVSAAPELRTSSSTEVPSLRLEDLPSASAATSHVAPSAASPLVTAAPATPAMSATSAPVTPEPASLDASLAEEVQALDGVRAALRAGDPNAALAKLVAYDAKFPQKQLAREAALLRTRAERLRDGKSDAP